MIYMNKEELLLAKLLCENLYDIGGIIIEGDEMFQTIGKCIEKQIPKKPIDNRRCPNCNESVYYYDDEYEYEVKNEWCQNCGQHILWSEDR